MKQITIEVVWKNSAFEGSVLKDPEYNGLRFISDDFEDIANMGEANLDIEYQGYEDFGVDPPSWYKNKDYEIVYKFQDVASLLKAYTSYVSLAAISRVTGINQTLLSHYANGLKQPRRKQRDLIVSGLHKIGETLKGANLSL